MKIAVSGKGGVGKSTVAASIALLLAEAGERVLALDADPDANLAAALGIPPGVPVPRVAEQIGLIEERTGAKVNEYGRVFKLNPEVSDLAGTLSVRFRGVDLITLGGVVGGGTGCACPINAFIKALVNDLVLYQNESLIMDMEAGIEHLGRATATGVDIMVVVVEPGRRAVECAESVITMSRHIGISRFIIAGNKINGERDRAFIKDAFPAFDVTDFLPYSESIRDADMSGAAALDGMGLSERDIMKGLVNRIITFKEGKV